MSNVLIKSSIDHAYEPVDSSGNPEDNQDSLPVNNDDKWFILKAESPEENIFYFRPASAGAFKEKNQLGWLTNVFWFGLYENYVAFQIGQPARSTFPDKDVAEESSMTEVTEYLNTIIGGDEAIEQSFIEAFASIPFVAPNKLDRSDDFKMLDQGMEVTLNTMLLNMNVVPKLAVEENSEALMKIANIFDAHLFQMVALADENYPDRDEMKNLNKNFFSIPNNKNQMKQAIKETEDAYESPESALNIRSFLTLKFLEVIFFHKGLKKSKQFLSRMIFSALEEDQSLDSLDSLMSSIKSGSDFTTDSLNELASNLDQDSEAILNFESIISEYFDESGIKNNAIFVDYKSPDAEITSENLKDFYDGKALLTKIFNEIDIDDLNSLKNNFFDNLPGFLEISLICLRYSKNNLNDNDEFEYFVKRNIAFGNISTQERKDIEYNYINIDLLSKDGRRLRTLV